MQEGTTKTYHLYQGGLIVHLGWIIPLVVALGFTIAIVAAPGARGAPPPFVPLLPLAVAAGMLFYTLRLPRRVDVHPDGSMEWIASARSIRLQPSDVLSITPAGNALGYLVLRHNGGRFRFVNQFTGFHELLTELQRRNPRVELRGC